MHRARATVFAAAFAIVIVAPLREASAQDFGLGPQKEPSGLVSRVGLETVWATFDLNGTHGDYFGVTARGDFRVSRIVSLRVLIPMYGLRLDDEGTSYNVGFGDAELRLRVRFYDTDPWRFYAGIADQLPTGNTSIGLGQGGTQLSPFITGGWRGGPVVLYGIFADAIGLNPQDKPAPFDYVDPSTNHELRCTLGALVEFGKSAFINVPVTAVTLLEPGQLGDTLVSGGLALGYQLGSVSKIVAVGQLPLAGEHRFDAKVGLNVYFFF